MNRRDFVRLTGAAASVGALAEALVSAQARGQTGVRPRSDPGLTPPAAVPVKTRMNVGTQHGDSDAILRVLAGFGVNHICSRLPSAKMDDAWTVDGLSRLRERVESFGITLDMVPLPLSSYEISRSENPAILLARDPERDRQIDDICQMIRNASRAGIPSVKYNLTLIGIPRTPPTAGRGGARYSTFVYAEAKQDPLLTIAGRVDADTYWERITYFLKRVVPVAEEHKVRLACHPQDPGMPPGRGWRGVETVLGSVDGLKRFVSIAESPFHGLNFCQGTVSEMLERPGEQIFDVIRYFGERRKIFNVHFRNISGGFLNFRETFIDDGDVDMLKAMRVYRDIGYDGMMMPDHVPSVDGDTDRLQGFAFAFGYIKALIAAVAAETAGA
jgi:mannonate dehydratase